MHLADVFEANSAIDGLTRRRGFGVSKVLITIFPKNKSSIKVTEALGGVYQDTVDDQKSGHQINRYWIELE